MRSHHSLVRRRSIRVGTRSSALAMIQAAQLCVRLSQVRGVPHRLLEVVKFRNVAAPAAGVNLDGKGMFTHEIDAALVAGRIDLAVHSLKDIPGLMPEGITIGCCLARADPRDALVAPVGTRVPERLANLPRDRTVGTASPRRRAQLLRMNGKQPCVELRGNVPTRIAKIDGRNIHFSLLAAAGLDRLAAAGSLPPVAAARLPVEEVLPAPGQGIIAIVRREGDAEMAELLDGIGDNDAGLAAKAERALVKGLGGDCNSPIAGLAAVAGGVLKLRAQILSPNGETSITESLAGPPEDARKTGSRLAARLLARAGPGFFG